MGPEASESAPARQPPDVHALLRALDDGGVEFVVTGSAAVMLHGVPLEPGDLDITRSLARDNLTRLAAVLETIEARPDPRGPFGHWERGADGEQHWVETAATPEAIAARASWRPGPADPTSFDHLLQSRHGALDVVPEVSGTYDDLIGRAVRLESQGIAVWVESIEDLLATLTVPRRAKDHERVDRLRALQSARHRCTPRHRPTSRRPRLRTWPRTQPDRERSGASSRSSSPTSSASRSAPRSSTPRTSAHF